MGQRSDFSKPCQGAAEKSANATRCCCLARGRISTISANKRHQLRLVPFLRLDGADENRAAVRRPQATSPVQRRRPLPVAETGRSCWGSVLIFQSPAKGLRKNQQTQPVAVAWSAGEYPPSPPEVTDCILRQGEYTYIG